MKPNDDYMDNWIKDELNQLAYDGDFQNDMRLIDIYRIVQMFRVHNRIGLNLQFVIPIVQRLLNDIPVAPLTGEEDEWMDPDYLPDGHYIQFNGRYNSVYRMDGDNRTARLSGARMYTLDGGYTWKADETCEVWIQFPFEVPLTPERVYLKELEDGRRIDISKKPKEIQILRELYIKEHVNE